MNDYFYDQIKGFTMNVNRLSIIIITAIWSILLNGQSGFTSLGGANFLGYSRAGVNLAGIESIYLNQAGLVGVKNFAIDLSVEKRFNLADLSNGSIALAKSFKFGTMGLMFSSFGITEYNEQKLGFAYARKLNSNISIGGQFDVLRYNVASVGSIHLVSFELGIQLRLNKDFSVATHIFSPGNIEVTDGTEIGTRFRIGVKYAPSAKVFVLAELDKVIDRDIDYKLGIGYQLIDLMQLRVGMDPKLNTYSFGIMLKFKDTYKVSSAISVNHSLGNTPAISLQYQQ